MTKQKRPRDQIPWPFSAEVMAAVYRQPQQTTAKWLGWKRKTATGQSNVRGRCVQKNAQQGLP